MLFLILTTWSPNMEPSHYYSESWGQWALPKWWLANCPLLECVNWNYSAATAAHSTLCSILLVHLSTGASAVTHWALVHLTHLAPAVIWDLGRNCYLPLLFCVEVLLLVLIMGFHSPFRSLLGPGDPLPSFLFPLFCYILASEPRSGRDWFSVAHHCTIFLETHGNFFQRVIF